MTEEETEHEQAAAAASPRKLTLLPLVALIFYEVSGGPFGVERAVSAGTPLLAILGFIIFPLVWSVPEALITAELGSAYPDDGGFVTWVTAAFGPYWGFQTGWWSWLSGVTDNAVYPILFLNYITADVPELQSGLLRWIFVFSTVGGLTFLAYRGVAVVGKVAVLLCGFTLTPFVCMLIVGLPQIEPSRLLVVEWDDVQWAPFLNCLFWNLNYWDSISTMIGEVRDPQQTLPRAMRWAVVLVVASYLLPLVVGIGVSQDWRVWHAGYFSEIGKQLGGYGLYIWIVTGACVSNFGLFLAEMSSDAYQLLGMAELGDPNCDPRLGDPQMLVEP